MEKATNVIASNKKAYFNYTITDKYEAGMELFGSEVKSVRAGGISVNESFAFFKNGELFIKNVYIKPYEKATAYLPNARRDIKLLLNRRELEKIFKQVQVKGYSVLPLKVYIVRGLVKAQIGIGLGKKLYDKRDVLAKRTLEKNELRRYKNFRVIN